MEIYKKASKTKLRFTTSKGELNTEQLWTLSLNELDTLAVSLETEHKESGKKSFLTPKSGKDLVAKLKFDIVLDILTTKQEDSTRATKRAEAKANNAKIMELIQEKKDKNLGEKSIKELEKLLVDVEEE